MAEPSSRSPGCVSDLASSATRGFAAHLHGSLCFFSWARLVSYVHLDCGQPIALDSLDHRSALRALERPSSRQPGPRAALLLPPRLALPLLASQHSRPPLLITALAVCSRTDRRPRCAPPPYLELTSQAQRTSLLTPTSSATAL